MGSEGGPATPGPAGVVTELWRFPVKSLQGERLERATITAAGVAGDRVHAVRDRASGKVMTAKRYGALLDGAARTEADGTVVVCLPHGEEVAAGDPAVDDLLSAWLGTDVVLGRAGDPGSTAFEMSFDAEHPDREIFEWACPAGTFVDLAAVHLMTTASLAAAKARYPAGDWDVRRFRPNVVVEGAGEGFVEDAWVERTVDVGGAALRGSMATIRCPMPSRAQPGLARDTRVAATLRDHHDNNLGLYCDVVEAGAVGVGDGVHVHLA
ncbi:MAG: MOSC domain-containing protein [Actinobacteria bacterium]|nr:MOSC domain-containing protein [Actinomycetota bacterium]